MKLWRKNTEAWKTNTFMSAATCGDLAIVKQMLKGSDSKEHINDTANIDVGYFITRGTALHGAALNGHIEIVKTLIDHGADVNVIEGQRQTPLHCAARKGKVNVVKFLVEKGANVNAQERDGLTPLDYAAKNGEEETVSVLLSHGAKRDVRNGDVRTTNDANSVRPAREIGGASVSLSPASKKGKAPVHSSC